MTESVSASGWPERPALPRKPISGPARLTGVDGRSGARPLRSSGCRLGPDDSLPSTQHGEIHIRRHDEKSGGPTREWPVEETQPEEWYWVAVRWAGRLRAVDWSISEIAKILRVGVRCVFSIERVIR